MLKKYDVAVIGGGPGGYSAAIKAAQLGGKVVIFEKENVGGTCLNVGCIPTKCLLDKAALIDKIRKNTENGIFKEAGLFSWKKVQENKDSVVKKLTSGVEGIMRSYGIDVVKGKALVREPGLIVLEGNGGKYEAGKIIIATGSKVFVPKIKGIEKENVIDSTKALGLKKVPISLVIIGGGVIGLEFASIYSTFGTNVTVIEMLPSILPNEDREVVAGLYKELEKRKIKIITGARVEEICEGSGTKVVRYSKDKIVEGIEAEYVLVAVGRVPNIEGIDTEKLGLELDAKGNIKVNNCMETNITGIYAVGDVIGGYQLAHSAYAEAEIASENCLGGNLHVKLDIMPRCIYSLPQFAAVGLSEESAKEKGIAYEKSVFPYIANGKALASDESSGFVKVICEKDSGKVIGVHIVGGYATELLSSAFTAMNMGAAVNDFYHMVFPHPTLSELIKESVLAVKNIAIHIPKINNGGDEKCMRLHVQE